MVESASEFFVASAGAAAALAGLIIVALSVSVDAIIRMPGMPARAATAIALLVVATLISLAGLIPGQSQLVLGIEVLLPALAALGFALASLVRMVRGHGDFSVASAAVRGGLALVPAVLFLVGAVLVLADAPAAMPVLGAGMLLAIAVSVATAWVVMVEIRR
jgi:modulator of FtsH protease